MLYYIMEKETEAEKYYYVLSVAENMSPTYGNQDRCLSFETELSHAEMIVEVLNRNFSK